MKVFITGGAGFIGTNLVRVLLKMGIGVTIYDNLSSSNYDLIRTLVDNKQVSFIKGDVRDKESLIKHMKDHDIVIHLAAQLEVTKSYNNAEYDLAVNTIGTLNVIEACKLNNIKRLINASSACVYGHTNGIPSVESDQKNPNWEYGVSKLASEKYIEISGLDYTNLRFSIVFGENEWYGRVLTLFVKRALNSQDTVIFGDGNQQRDYVHVMDVVDFIIECIHNPITINKAYNVSTGSGIKVKDLAELVCSRFKDIHVIYEGISEGEKSGIITGRERLKNELKYLILNNSLAKSDTKWYPTRDIYTELDNYIRWARSYAENWKYYKV